MDSEFNTTGTSSLAPSGHSGTGSDIVSNNSNPGPETSPIHTSGTAIPEPILPVGNLVIHPNLNVVAPPTLEQSRESFL